MVSILVDIAYNNPRTYSLVIVCIGKILSIEPDKEKVNEIYDLIYKKFENKPNVGYWKVWFQRLTIKQIIKVYLRALAYAHDKNLKTCMPKFVC